MESIEQIKARIEAAVPGARLEIIPNDAPSNQPSLLVDAAHAFDAEHGALDRHGGVPVDEGHHLARDPSGQFPAPGHDLGRDVQIVENQHVDPAIEGALIGPHVGLDGRWREERALGAGEGDVQQPPVFGETVVVVVVDIFLRGLPEIEGVKSAEEVAEAVVYLCSPNAAAVTGATGQISTSHDSKNFAQASLSLDRVSSQEPMSRTLSMPTSVR